MCDLQLAVDLLTRRKRTVLTGAEEDHVQHDQAANGHVWALLCAGTKVDAECLHNAATVAAHGYVPALARRVAAIPTDDDVDDCDDPVLAFWDEVAMALAGAYAEGVLTGLLVQDPPPPWQRTPVEQAEQLLTQLFGARVTVVPWAPGRPPLWTRYCEGVREAERDRRRHARQRPAIRSRHHPAG